MYKKIQFSIYRLLRFTSTGRAIRRPEKFQFLDRSMESKKSFRKPYRIQEEPAADEQSNVYTERYTSS